MKNDLLCFSHLRWNFVYQRPQHLMTRFARHARVYYIEEPVFTQAKDKYIIRKESQSNVRIVTPNLFEGGNAENFDRRMEQLMEQLITDENITNFISWYYFPMALSYTSHLQPDMVIYDCMDELSAFKFAPPALIEFERQLFKMADLVFTGGIRLYQAKRNWHDHIFPYPSSIDKEFFYPARSFHQDPADQYSIPHPRLGFYGVLDERFDIDLVDRLAKLKPEWQFVYIGPVVKIDPDTLPKHSNIHYLGIKAYKDLPAYIAGWDLCLMPFAINASTEFISPTKTPEFLAAGKRVISTPIHDVVHPYGGEGLVGIASTAEEFIEIASHDLQLTDRSAWLEKVDQFLSKSSWEKTWKEMVSHMEKILHQKHIDNLQKEHDYV